MKTTRTRYQKGSIAKIPEPTGSYDRSAAAKRSTTSVGRSALSSSLAFKNNSAIRKSEMAPRFHPANPTWAPNRKSDFHHWIKRARSRRCWSLPIMPSPCRPWPSASGSPKTRPATRSASSRPTCSAPTGESSYGAGRTRCASRPSPSSKS
jgi:hypothetical protein